MANRGPILPSPGGSPFERTENASLRGRGTGPIFPPNEKNPVCDALSKRGSFFVHYN